MAVPLTLQKLPLNVQINTGSDILSTINDLFD